MQMRDAINASTKSHHEQVESVKHSSLDTEYVVKITDTIS
jgi:hypothetical protein